MKDIETKERFIELRAAGKSFETIALELSVSKPVLIGWSRELAHEVGNLRTIRMEALQEQYHVAQARRIEALGKRLQAILDELDRRDMSHLPTEKLLDMALKYTAALKGDECPVTFHQPGTIDDITDIMNPVQSWRG